MSSNICKSSKLLLVVFVILVTIPISKSQSEEETDLVSEGWGTTDVSNTKLLFTWIITNFHFSYPKWGDVIVSPTFSGNDGCKWYLQLQMAIEPAEDNQENFGLYLFSVNCDSTVTYTYSILNATGQQTNSRKFSNQHIEPGQSWGFKYFVWPISVRQVPVTNLLRDNKLIIICEIVTKIITENSFSQPKRHLLTDFGLLFENQDLADVTLLAGGRKFKAHKAILAARSPVFKARFEEDGKKQNDCAIEVTDLDPKVFGEMLRYIYTEKVSNVEIVTPNLLAAAENYKLEGLKTLCENALRSNLNVENAIDFLILGDKYRAVELKNDAKKFIVAHASDVSNTTEFKSLILTHPQLFVEIFDLVG